MKPENRIYFLRFIFSVLIIPLIGAMTSRSTGEEKTNPNPHQQERNHQSSSEESDPSTKKWISSIPPELKSPNRRRVQTEGMPDDNNHDPSNIIFYKGRYYCWYTEHFRDKYKPFIGTRIRLMTSEQGDTWSDQGVVLGPDENTSWDAKGALTPYVVPNGEHYYMFYTAVPEGFRAPRKTHRTVSIAVARATTPGGPWKRLHSGPVFEPAEEGWDRQHVDDANLVRRNGTWWLYYKGFTQDDAPSETRIGVATSENLTGPYRRHSENPVLKGHAFSAWKHREGVGLIAGKHGKQVVFWAHDGIDFRPAGPFPNVSTGVFCPRNFQDGSNPDGISWGIDTTRASTRALFRFRCDLKP